ncbi:hypothetical protein [Aquipuribacter nitratireducens]|uniref:Uncharacterized protein n=1 Tax=Aquipuribacter nitratireducens TaxID=650104 RepID=A0ABW0GNU7_9MICO
MRTSDGPSSRDVVEAVRVGVVTTDGVRDDLADAVARALPEALARRVDADVPWAVERGGGPGHTPDLVDTGRRALLERGWDLAVVLTGDRLDAGGAPVLARAHPVHGVGVLSVPALGASRVERRGTDAVADLVVALLGGGPGGGDADDVAARARELRDDEDGGGRRGSSAAVAGHVLGGNLRLLLGLVRANRPWRLALRLSRTLAAAAAAGVLALVTPDVWVLADAYGPLRLALLGAASVLVTGTVLVVGAGLWERARGQRSRRQVALFNLASVLSVLVGVTVLHLALLALALVAAVALLVPGVVADAVGHDVGLPDLLRLAWFTTTLSTVAGALGAGLEDDDDVRDATYARQDVRVEDYENSAL